MQPQLPADLLDILVSIDKRVSVTEKSLTNDAVPIGAQFIWPAAANLLPYNYKVCDGSALDRTAFAALFAEIGTAHGVGDGSSTFNIPNQTISGAGNQISYVEYTSSVTVSSTTNNLETNAATIVTAAAFTATGLNSYWIEFYCPNAIAGAGTAVSSLLFVIYDGAASIGGIWGQVTNPSTSQLSVPVLLRKRLTPAVGTRTYSVRAYAAVSNGNVGGGVGGAGVLDPGFIHVSSADDPVSQLAVIKVL